MTTSSSEIAYDFLRNALNAAPKGKKLPSLRQVARECKVSKIAVGRALAQLQGEGLIESRPRSGLFRSQKILADQKIIHYLFFGHANGLNDGGFHSTILSCLASKLGQPSSLRAHSMPDEPDPAAVVRGILDQPSSLVITCCIDLDRLGLISPLIAAGLPCLHVFPNLVNPLRPCLTLNDTEMVRQQIEFLVGLGHRRIAYLHGARDGMFSRPIHVRRDVFCRLALEYNLELRPGFVRYVGWNPEDIRVGVHQLFSEPAKPTALVIYDQHVNPVYAELRAGGLVPGRDVSVLGMDDMPWAEHVDPPLTSLRVPRVEAVESMLEMLNEVQAGKDPGVRYIPTAVVARESTQKIAVL